jgi:uncharacterized protein RhaS with RHS repeats
VSQFTSAGVLTSVTDSAGNVTSVVSDGNGNPLSITDGEGRSTTFSYSGGLLNTITDFAGRTVTLKHDASGHLTELDLPDPGNGDPGNNEAQSVTSFGYDPSTAQMTSLTDASGTTNFSYNAFRGTE